MKIRQEQIRVIFILDEFDHACNLFEGDTARFQGIRELAYQPEWHIDWVFISRRSIRDIELRTQAISNLGGIVLPHYLGMFTEDEMPAYFQRLEEVGLFVTPAMRERIDFYCGRHPYLLEAIGGKLGQYSDATTGLRPPCPNIHQKNVWPKVRTDFHGLTLCRRAGHSSEEKVQ